MHARALTTLIVISILFTAAGRMRADPSAASALPGDMIRTATDYGLVIVPPAWAGVWDIYEETRDCDGGPVIATRSYLDTLCAGESIYPLAGEAYPVCSGAGFTDTALELTCYDQGNYFPCSWTQTEEANWTLAGDVATTVLTFTYYVSGPPECERTTCRRTTGTRTRILPESSVCGVVPALRQTWGSLKLRYR